MTNRRLYVRILSVSVLAAALAFLGLILKGYIDGSFRSVDSFQTYVRQYGVFGPLFLMVFQAVQVVLPVLPGLFGCAAGAVMYGPLIGFLCNYIGICTGSILAFSLARKYGTPLIRDLFPSEKYRRWSSKASGSNSYVAFLFLAMVLPLFPDDYLCYFSGVTEMKTKKFVWIILLGKPWCILAYSLGFSIIQ